MLRDVLHRLLRQHDEILRKKCIQKKDLLETEPGVRRFLDLIDAAENGWMICSDKARAGHQGQQSSPEQHAQSMHVDDGDVIFSDDTQQLDEKRQRRDFPDARKLVPFLNSCIELAALGFRFFVRADLARCQIDPHTPIFKSARQRLAVGRNAVVAIDDLNQKENIGGPFLRLGRPYHVGSPANASSLSVN